MRYNFVLPNNDNVPIGGYKIIYEYANLLAEEGHDVTITFMLFDATPFSYDSFRGKIRKFIISLLFFMGKIPTSQKSVDWFELDSRIRLRFSLPWSFFFSASDIVIATAWHTAYTVRRLHKNKGRKFYMIQHNEEVFGPKNLVRKTWFFPLKKIAVASWLKDLVESVTNQEVDLVKNFVDTKTFFITTPIDKRKNVVSMLYHDNPSKGSADGLSILKKVKTCVPDLEVKLFGTGNPPEDLPNYFEFIHKANTTQLRQIYNQSIIYLFPSHLEGWGLTATEAMACGAALVSTKNGGVNDFGIQNKTALLSDVGDIDAISENIINLIKNPEKRKEIAQNGHDLVSGLTKENSFSELKKSLNI